MIFEKGFATQLVSWVVIGLVCFAIISGMIIIAPDILPVDDSHALLRSIVLSVPLAVIGIVLLLGAMVAFEFVTPTNYLTTIGEHPIASAILMSAFMFSIAFIIAGQMF